MKSTMLPIIQLRNEKKRALQIRKRLARNKVIRKTAQKNIKTETKKTLSSPASLAIFFASGMLCDSKKREKKQKVPCPSLSAGKIFLTILIEVYLNFFSEKLSTQKSHALQTRSDK